MTIYVTEDEDFWLIGDEVGGIYTQFKDDETPTGRVISLLCQQLKEDQVESE